MTQTARTRRWTRRSRGIVGLVGLSVVVLTACDHASGPNHAKASSSVAAEPSSAGATASPASQVVLPFTNLNVPRSVAVDTAGDVYVTDAGNSRVLKLPAA